ncbi:MAG: hypothetical protein M9909_13565 [Thermomicrobiales bacterium]|nr:hypothetical protein [Thermomicrobiales bacterium]
MDERNDHDQVAELQDEHLIVESPISTPTDDMAFFHTLREVVRTEHLWQWEAGADDTKSVLKALPQGVKNASGFRVVGDATLEDHVFDLTLWLEDQHVFRLADIDVMLLDALSLDLGRGTLLVRELTRQGLMYHILVFGEARARELRVNVIGPRMQHIRDLGTLVVSSVDSFSA